MSDSEKKTNCVSSCFNEFKPLQPWFKVEEEETQRVLDIPRSFCPCTTFDIVAKCLAFGYHVSTLVFTLIKTDDVAFFWAFFTNVALGLTIVYATISVLNSFFPVQQPEGPVVQARIKFTWLFFVLSIFGEAMASILFWVLVFDGDSASYADIAPHGIVFAVLLVEGFFVNRIPLRWMHFWSCLALTLAYIIWSIIHGPLVLDLGNPTTEDNDPDTNDDALYADLSWDEDDIGVSRTRLNLLVVQKPCTNLTVFGFVLCFVSRPSFWSALCISLSLPLFMPFCERRPSRPCCVVGPETVGDTLMIPHTMTTALMRRIPK